MTINILTLFPDFFVSGFNSSILKRAQAKGLVKVNIINIRDFTHDKHQTADDRPFGGGPGMVMKIEPIYEALQSLEAAQVKGKVILTAADGRLFNQEMAQQLATQDTITIICGHYQGVDQRVADHLIDEEVRIGDYVLTGGEAAGLVITDAVVRLLPGVLGNEDSIEGESHAAVGQGSYPNYTRPEEFRGWKVPEVLLGGNHAEIEEWRNGKRKKL